MHRISHLLRPWLAPAAGGVFLAIWLIAEAGRFSPQTVALTIVFSAAITVSRMLPAVALLVAAAIPVLQATSVLPRLESTTWPIYGAIVIVVYFAATHGRVATRWTALALALPVGAAVMWAIVVPSAAYPTAWRQWVNEPNPPTVTVTAVSIGGAVVSTYLVAWIAGVATRLALRNRRAQSLLAGSSSVAIELAAELRVLEERERIATDLHDLLAHSLSVVVAQADGARLNRRADRAALEASFAAIADVARAAMTDVRGVVEGLRDDTDSRPQPSIRDLDDLLGTFELAGLPVGLEQRGIPSPLTPARGLAVYRVVQESLTNALRHGDRSEPVNVSLDWNSEGVAIVVESQLRTDASSLPLSSVPAAGGRGIRGMIDRVRLAGGSLQVDRGASWFQVRAYLPVGDAATQLHLDAPLGEAALAGATLAGATLAGATLVGTDSQSPATARSAAPSAR